MNNRSLIEKCPLSVYIKLTSFEHVPAMPIVLNKVRCKRREDEITSKDIPNINQILSYNLNRTIHLIKMLFVLAVEVKGRIKNRTYVYCPLWITIDTALLTVGYDLSQFSLSIIEYLLVAHLTATAAFRNMGSVVGTLFETEWVLNLMLVLGITN